MPLLPNVYGSIEENTMEENMRDLNSILQSEITPDDPFEANDITSSTSALPMDFNQENLDAILESNIADVWLESGNTTSVMPNAITHALDLNDATFIHPQVTVFKNEFPLEHLIKYNVVTPLEKVQLVIFFLCTMRKKIYPSGPEKATWIEDETIARFMPENLKVLMDEKENLWILSNKAVINPLAQPYLSPYQQKDAEYGISLPRLNYVIVFNALTLVSQLFTNTYYNHPYLVKVFEEIKNYEFGICSTIDQLIKLEDKLKEDKPIRKWSMRIFNDDFSSL
jgi:hypothetical protein